MEERTKGDAEFQRMIELQRTGCNTAPTNFSTPAFLPQIADTENKSKHIKTQDNHTEQKQQLWRATRQP